MKCVICEREHGPFALQRGDKAACLTCMTINDPCEVMKKIDAEDSAAVEEMARSLGMVMPSRGE